MLFDGHVHHLDNHAIHINWNQENIVFHLLLLCICFNRRVACVVKEAFTAHPWNLLSSVQYVVNIQGDILYSWIADDVYTWNHSSYIIVLHREIIRFADADDAGAATLIIETDPASSTVYYTTVYKLLRYYSIHLRCNALIIYCCGLFSFDSIDTLKCCCCCALLLHYLADAAAAGETVAAAAGRLTIQQDSAASAGAPSLCSLSLSEKIPGILCGLLRIITIDICLLDFSLEMLLKNAHALFSSYII